jgi:hypothetical protein
LTGSDIIDGGSGTDILDVVDDGPTISSIAASPPTGYQRITFSNGDTDDFKGIEILIGTYGNDVNMQPWS